MIGLSFLTDANAVIIGGVGILAGGLLMVKRVSETMSQRITTTHVTCGSLFGIGLLTKQGDSWITTLPVAAGIGALCWYVFNR